MTPAWFRIIAFLKAEMELWIEEKKKLEAKPLPCGYKFAPTDIELLLHFLLSTILGCELPADNIEEFKNLHRQGPDELPINQFREGQPNEAFYFTELDGNLISSSEIPTENGYWASEKEDAEEIESHDVIIGFKRSMFFHKGDSPLGVKTRWIMEEYRFNSSFVPEDAISADVKKKMKSYVVCRIRLEEESSESSFRPVDSSEESDGE